VIALLVAAAVAGGLRVLLYRLRIGIAMRAAVDDRALTRLSGARPDRGSMLAWAIGASLAALSGILIAPTLNVSALPLTLLIVNAYAAAMIGRLRNLPMTFVGALILGMSNEYLPDYLRRAGVGSRFLEGMYLSIPVIILFIVLLVLPDSRLRGHQVARGREIVPMPLLNGSLVFVAVVVAGAAMVASVVGRADLENISRVFGIAMIGISLIPLVGFAGQLSLCQLSFAGIGAVVMAHAGAGGNPLGLLAAAAVAGAVGALVALPALRLSGIYLALATAAFAVTMDRWIFPFPAFSIGHHRFDLFQEGSLTIPRPRLFGLRFDGQRAEFVLMAVGFCICTLVVVAVRRSTFGARLLAMKDSPAACATLGLNVTRTKLTVFAMSAALAGFGGALYGGAIRVAAASQFDFFTGLPILLVMVICGIGMVGGALACGILLGSPVLGNLLPGLPQLTLVLSGTAGIGMARNPNGFVLEIRDRWAPLWRRIPAAAAVGVALVGVWVLRWTGVIANWPYALASIGILAAAPGLALNRPARRPPLEWAGLTRPFAPEELIDIDRAVGVPELDIRAPA
jgi:branched-chain amino acid transport system permease protein